MKTEKSLRSVQPENLVPFRSASVFDEMEKMLDSFFPSSWHRPLKVDSAEITASSPQVDVIDKDDKMIVRASLPAVNKDDIEVTTTERNITIKGKTYHEDKQEDGEYFRREIHSGSFVRTVPLPTLIDEAHVEASFNDGILEVSLPKKTLQKRNSVKIN